MTDLRALLQLALATSYSIDRELGRGGMSTVFLAEDRKHHRPVAIKVLLPEISYALGGERFLREIELAASLSHPHILPLHDSGDADGILYYVMPFVDGETLRERLDRDGRLPVARALRIAREVADALDYAHRRGVVHRDIKPENILLSHSHALVADFGIGKMVSAAVGSQITHSGIAVGTPAYMSLEQAAGEAHLDGRSDIYSLGIVLFEMLTGTTPFHAPTVQAMIAKRFTSAVPSISDIRDDVPAAIQQAVETALARTPVDRFATGAEMARALGDVQAAGAPPPSASESRHATGLTPQALPSPRSIAVLPFTNMSADPENEYFSDGITEEIINELSRLRTVHVAARTSSFAFKGKQADLRNVGAQLNVRMVLEGSVRRSGNQLRITAQLINVADGYHIWSERYDRELRDVFAIQDEIASAIVNTLRITLLGASESTGTRRSANVQAYELYLKGRYYFNRGGLGRALTLFEQAARKDTSYAQPLAGVADCYFALANLSYLLPAEGYERARTAAERALALDDRLADAHAAMATIKCYYDWDWPAAEREFLRALDLNPGLANAHYFYALALASHGRAHDALGEATIARELDPLNRQIATGVARAHLVARRYDRAIEVLEQSLTLEPELSATHAWLAIAYLETGRLVDAADESARALALANVPVFTALDGYVAARVGSPQRAREVVRILEKRGGGVAIFVAWVYLGLDDHGAALEWLWRAYEEHSDWLIIIVAMPVCDPVRAEPRFAELVRKIGLDFSGSISRT